MLGCLLENRGMSFISKEESFTWNAMEHFAFVSCTKFIDIKRSIVSLPCIDAHLKGWKHQRFYLLLTFFVEFCLLLR